MQDSGQYAFFQGKAESSRDTSLLTQLTFQLSKLYQLKSRGSFVVENNCVQMWKTCLYLADSLPLHNKSFHLGEIVVVSDHIRDDGLFIWVLSVHI